jgi:hypothetical protein
MFKRMKIYPIGSVVTHKGKPEFGYGIIVDSFESEEEQMNEEIFAMILWHGDENIELRETPQLHKYSELKVLNTEVAFA